MPLHPSVAGREQRISPRYGVVTSQGDYDACDENCPTRQGRFDLADCTQCDGQHEIEEESCPTRYGSPGLLLHVSVRHAHDFTLLRRLQAPDYCSYLALFVFATGHYTITNPPSL